ncbi:MAG: hypothetical protein AAGA43_02440 [Bacteroidota bacterium]
MKNKSIATLKTKNITPLTNEQQQQVLGGGHVTRARSRTRVK